MKILILSQWCYPEPDLKALTFAKELERQGQHVEVLTGFPNYPGGKLYEGYRVKAYQREIIDGIVIHRVPLFPSHDRSRLRRIANYLTFAFSSALIGSLVTEKSDIVYAYHPPASVSFAAIVIKFSKGVPVVYDIQDLWPDTLAATGMLTNKRILGLVGAYCKLSYRFLDHIVVLSKGFKKRLIQGGVPEERISVIRNWSLSIPETESEQHELRKRLGWSGRFVVLFAGNIGHAQALPTVLEAARIVERDGHRVYFAFLGDGVALGSLKKRAVALGLSNVQFLPRVAAKEVGAYLQAADALLVHLRRDPLFRITIPSKIQAYLRAGRPILIGAEGEASELVTEANGGLAFEPENPVEMAEAVRELRDLDPEQREAMGKNGARFYREELSLELGTTRFIELFSHLIDAAV